MAKKVSNLSISKQSGTDRTVFATWSFSSKIKHLQEFKVVWYYWTTKGNGVWFVGSETTETHKQSVYSAPENASKVKCKVKPVSTTHQVGSGSNKKTKSYWSGTYATAEYTIPGVAPSTKPEKPSAPTVSMNGMNLTMEIDSYDKNTNKVEFQIVANNTKVYGSAKVNNEKNHASYTTKVTSGSTYKVRCRGIRSYTSTSTKETTKKSIADKYNTKIKGLNSSIENAKNVLRKLEMQGSNKHKIDVYKNIIGEYQLKLEVVQRDFSSKRTYTKIKTEKEEAGPWSEYSSSIQTAPSAVKEITKIEALTSTSVRVHWTGVSTAKNFTIEYTDNKEYFDSSSEVKSWTTPDWAAVNHAELTGLDSGRKWYFRVRANNDSGSSGWTKIKDITIGTAPVAPTTWSDTTTVVTGDTVYLYWVHNSEDGSSQTAAEIVLTIGSTSQTITPTIVATEPIQTYALDTSSYTEGTEIKWKVRTKGIIATYSPYSTERIITVYAKPTIEWEVLDYDEQPFDTLTSFPITINATARPSVQNVLGWNLQVASAESYETTNFIDQSVWVGEGEVIYSEFFDPDPENQNEKMFTLSAGDVNLENGQPYIIKLTAAMDSGLTADIDKDFDVQWADLDFEPDAQIGIGYEQSTISIMPFCLIDDEEDDTPENRTPNIMMAVYRIDYDGRLTEIASGLSNDLRTTVIDPHPSLYFAQYRIVAMSTITGQTSFIDTDPEYIGDPCIILQWDEEWENLTVDSDDEEEPESPAWDGMMVKLPFNIDTSEATDPEVELVEYIGRAHPVSYFGTQLGVTATWNTEIPDYDDDSLFALRRLAVYQGNVYVREPSGVGYWAVVKVGISQKHLERTIPITLTITRVEGGK